MTDQWYMDTDFCDNCDALLDDFGICPACGYDGYDYDEEDEYEPTYYEDEEDIDSVVQVRVRKPNNFRNEIGKARLFTVRRGLPFLTVQGD